MDEQIGSILAESSLEVRPGFPRTWMIHSSLTARAFIDSHYRLDMLSHGTPVSAISFEPKYLTFLSQRRRCMSGHSSTARTKSAGTTWSDR